LPGKASGQIALPEKRITFEQAPSDGGLFCLVVKKTTIPPRLAKVVIGSLLERGPVAIASLIGSLAGSPRKHPAPPYGGNSW
jgi:hypothetical protein